MTAPTFRDPSRWTVAASLGITASVGVLVALLALLVPLW